MIRLIGIKSGATILKNKLILSDIAVLLTDKGLNDGAHVYCKGKIHSSFTPFTFKQNLRVFYNVHAPEVIILSGDGMEFEDEKQRREFVEIVAMLQYYKSKGVPIPEDVREYIERNRDNDELFTVLSNIIRR